MDPMQGCEPLKTEGRRGRQGDSKQEKDLICCCQIGGRGACARTRKRPFGAKGSPQLTISKETGTSVLQ